MSMFKINIPKQALWEFLKTFVVFGLIVSLVDEFIGPFFYRDALGTIVWTAVCLGVMWFVAIAPFVEAIRRAQPKNDPLVKALERAQKEEKAREQAAANRPVVTEETQAIRAGRAADIRSCMTDSGYLWRWADTATITRLYVFKDGDAVVHSAKLVIDGERVSAIIASIEGKEVSFENATYKTTMKSKTEELNAPVTDFMAAVPDAVWYWDVYPNVITVTSEARGFDKCSATLKYQKDGTISSMLVTLPDGKTRRVMRKKASTVKESGQQASASSASSESQTSGADLAGRKEPGIPNAKRLEDDLSRTFVVSPREPEKAPTDVSTEEEFAGDGLLQPTQDPPVADSVLKRNAEQIAGDINGTLAELAMSAEAEGEECFTFAWPEGIQTQREAEFLAAALVDSGIFRKCEVNAERMTLCLYIVD